MRLEHVTFCKVFSFLNWFCVCAMQLSYSAIGLDRVLALYLPFSYRTWTRFHALFPLLGVTVVSGLASILPVFWYDIVETPHNEQDVDVYCKAPVSTEVFIDAATYTLFMSLPVSLVIIFNIMIVVALYRRRKILNSRLIQHNIQEV